MYERNTGQKYISKIKTVEIKEYMNNVYNRTSKENGCISLFFKKEVNFPHLNEQQEQPE